MEKFLTPGNILFAIGMALEVFAVIRGVHSQVVGLGMATYGLALWACGYLR
jgi:hypothetical protein